MEEILLKFLKDMPVALSFIGGFILGKKQYEDVMKTKINSIEVQLNKLNDKIQELDKHITSFDTKLKTISDIKSGVL